MNGYISALLIYMGLMFTSCSMNDRLDRIASAVEKAPAKTCIPGKL